jgi:hypothetical protein
MSATVVDLRPKAAKPEPLSISEYPLTVGDEIYHVRSALDSETRRGFVTIHDNDGRAVLVFSSSFPDEHISQLIVAWRAGHKQGLDRGRAEGIEIGKSNGAVSGRNHLRRLIQTMLIEMEDEQ